MSRTAASLRTDSTTRLAELERARPEWQVWLRLIGEVEDARLSTLDSRLMARESRVEGAPLIHGRTIELDAAELQRLIRRLLKKASELEGSGSLRGYRPSKEATVQLIAAAVRQDRDAIAVIAAAEGLDTGALVSVSHLAALPLLRASGRELQDRIPEYWPYGYCPICAAWPILAERRGLDRSRRLRCGRCASEWEMEWLLCAYCGERDHQKLGSLVQEDAGDTLKVETCVSCHGYLKSLATLQAILPFELLLRDLETLELDLVALDRGYGRPEGSGVAVEVEIV